ncbi:O-antigen polymerase, partial [Oenococcus oeni]|uniref:O-antigen polymerase n=4 Tax=Oenococcus oeni TaxID=1247 RepID=UPI00117CBB0F
MNNRIDSNSIKFFLILLYFLAIGFLGGVANFFLGTLILFFLLIYFKFSVSVKPLAISYGFLVIYSLIISLINFSNINLDLFQFLKNLMNFLNPVIFLALGIVIHKFVNSKIMINIIILTALFFSVFHLAELSLDSSIFESFSGTRDIVRNATDIIPIALVIVLFRNEFCLEIKSKLAYFYEIIFTFSLLMSFSRTLILIFLVYSIVILFYGKTKGRFFIFFRYILFFSVFGFIFYMFIPEDIKIIFFTKISDSLQEVKSTNNWDNYYQIVHDWRGFEKYSAILQFKQYSILSKIFGKGLSQGIYVGPYSELLSFYDGYIPFLHNGYYTILIKLGLVGVFYYLFFVLGNIIFYIKKIKYNTYYIIVVALLSGVLISTYIV